MGHGKRLGHGVVMWTWWYDENADSFSVNVIEQQVKWAVPGVASEGVELAWLASSIVVSPEMLDMFAAMDMSGIGPAIALAAPGPNVAVSALGLAFFPRPQEVAERVAQQVERDTAREGTSLAV